MNRAFLALTFSVASVVVGCSARGGEESNLGSTDESLSTVPACGGGDGSTKKPLVIGAAACSFAPTAAASGAPVFFSFDPALAQGTKISIATAAGGKGVITTAEQNADGSCGALLGSLDKAPELPSVVAPSKGLCIVVGRVVGSILIGTPPAAAPDAGAAPNNPDVCAPLADKNSALQAQVNALTAQVAQLKSQCGAAPAAPSSCQSQLDNITKLVATVQADVTKLNAATTH